MSSPSTTSRLVVDEDDNGNFRIERVKQIKESSCAETDYECVVKLNWTLSNKENIMGGERTCVRLLVECDR